MAAKKESRFGIFVHSDGMGNSYTGGSIEIMQARSEAQALQTAKRVGESRVDFILDRETGEKSSFGRDGELLFLTPYSEY